MIEEIGSIEEIGNGLSFEELKTDLFYLIKKKEEKREKISWRNYKIAKAD